MATLGNRVKETAPDALRKMRILPLGQPKSNLEYQTRFSLENFPMLSLETISKLNPSTGAWNFLGVSKETKERYFQLFADAIFSFQSQIGLHSRVESKTRGIQIFQGIV